MVKAIDSVVQTYQSFKGKNPRIAKGLEITLLVTGILLTLLFLSTLTTGGLAIGGLHGWQLMQSLSSTLAHYWVGIPYGMTGLGLAGVLATLGAMLFGVHLITKSNENKKIPQFVVKEEQRVVFNIDLKGDIVEEEKVSEEFSIQIVQIDGNKTIILSKEHLEKSITLQKYSTVEVDGEKNKKDKIYYWEDKTVAKRMAEEKLIFIFEATNQLNGAVFPGNILVYYSDGEDLEYEIFKDTDTDKINDFIQKYNIITDIDTFHALANKIQSFDKKLINLKFFNHNDIDLVELENNLRKNDAVFACIQKSDELCHDKGSYHLYYINDENKLDYDMVQDSEYKELETLLASDKFKNKQILTDIKACFR